LVEQVFNASDSDDDEMRERYERVSRAQVSTSASSRSTSRRIVSCSESMSGVVIAQRARSGGRLRACSAATCSSSAASRWRYHSSPIVRRCAPQLARSEALLIGG
jgi:hypothetical protein